MRSSTSVEIPLFARRLFIDGLSCEAKSAVSTERHTAVHPGSARGFNGNPLKPADVHDALAYAQHHLDEIEADLTADDEASVKGRRGAP